MRKYVVFCFMLLGISAHAKVWRLDSCQQRALANYPLIKQYGLIEKTAEYNLTNASSAYLPQFSIAIKATYQSDVTEIPEMLTKSLSQLTGKPVSFPSMSKDQYQAVVEANQLLWDGGQIAAQKHALKAASLAEARKLDVELYALKDRVNQLYFAVLLVDEQLKQLQILQAELASNQEKIQSLQQNGVATQSDLDVIRVEIVNARQKELDLRIVRKAYLQMLSAYCNEAFNEDVVLDKPEMLIPDDTEVNHRPELGFFDAQDKMLESQRATVLAANRPKLGFFLQGGYGRPALNMFDGNFAGFYIGGLRLSWNLSGFYTQKNNLNKIETGRKSNEILRETFVFNNNLLTSQQKNELEKLRLTITNDSELLRLRSRIKQSAEAKVANGTLTVTDLMREITAEDLARQQKILHEIQLLMTVYQFKNSTNN